MFFACKPEKKKPLLLLWTPSSPSTHLLSSLSPLPLLYYSFFYHLFLSPLPFFLPTFNLSLAFSSPSLVFTPIIHPLSSPSVRPPSLIYSSTSSSTFNSSPPFPPPQASTLSLSSPPLHLPLESLYSEPYPVFSAAFIASSPSFHFPLLLLF